jgi:SAM-dependent methyltransferase
VRFGEWVLLRFSRSPQAGDFIHSDVVRTNVTGALGLLKRVFPDFDHFVRGKRVLDFGCGQGFQSVALGKLHDCDVVGIDTNEKTLALAREVAREAGLGGDNPCFVTTIPAEWRETFDVVISQDSFEHFPDPVAILNDMITLIRPDGRILITFGPPWYAPHGSHMHFFCKLPWINLIFSEETVMSVRSNFRKDGAKKYEDVESGLNCMSLGKFERIVSACGMRIALRNYECVKRLNFLSRVPLVRELFVNQITAVRISVCPCTKNALH